MTLNSGYRAVHKLAMNTLCSTISDTYYAISILLQIHAIRVHASMVARALETQQLEHTPVNASLAFRETNVNLEVQLLQNHEIVPVPLFLI